MARVVRERVSRVVAAICLGLVLLFGGGLVWASVMPAWETLGVDQVRVHTDSPNIVMRASHGECDSAPEGRVLGQTHDHVVVEVRDDVSGSCIDIAASSEHTVRADDLLGERRVVVRGLLTNATCTVDGQPSKRCTLGTGSPP